jgi:polysaccharide pyruvyl transferase WcaK-like protein
MNTNLNSWNKSQFRENSEIAEIKVVLLWHSATSDNFGVGALTDSQMEICESAARRANVKLTCTVIGTEGGSRYAIGGTVVERSASLSLKKIFSHNSEYRKKLRECDLVLDIGEGDSFTDIYGSKRYFLLLSTKILALIAGKPLILSPQTIGPFNRWWARLGARFVMRRCEKIIARDGLSAEFVRSLGISINLSEAIDVAFRLPYERKAGEKSELTRIGLNVSGLLYSGGYDGSNQFGLSLDYRLLMRKLLDAWTSAPKTEVWLIPHVVPDNIPKDDDRVAIEDLMKAYPSIKVAPSFSGPRAAKSFIAGMDFVSGARMHACIAAFSAGVAVVPVAYSRKFSGLFSALDYPWVVDARADSTSDALEKILTACKNRVELKARVGAGNEIAANRLMGYEDTLVDVFRALRSKATHQPESRGV